MIVEYSATGSFADRRRVVGPAALEDTDFTARVDLTELPAGQRLSYRVQFQDLSDLRTFSLPVEGSFQTASDRADRDVVFSFSGDSVGQQRSRYAIQGWVFSAHARRIRRFHVLRRAHRQQDRQGQRNMPDHWRHQRLRCRYVFRQSNGRHTAPGRCAVVLGLQQ